MKMTAPDLLRLRVIDGIIPEPVGGAHRDWDAAAAQLRTALAEHLAALTRLEPEALVTDRYERFRRIGAFEENALPTR
jgi:acetyl-CoA carboxylase carboxyl transferase subunit alpha